MKRLALFWFLSIAVTAQATTWSTNGSASDVQAKHAQASNGDTITIPSGNFTWPLNGVYITKGITLSGAGVGVSNITLSGTHPGFHITKNATGIIKVQNMTFIATGGAGTLPDPILLDGTWPSGQPIIFSNVGITLSGESMVSCNLAGGVIFSHITFTGTWNDFFISVKDQVNNNSWTTADTIGIRDTIGTSNIYIEDSTFTGGSNGIIDCDDNCRVVLRHNTAHNSGFFNSHGFDTSPHGARHFEIYENTLDLPDKGCSGCGNSCLSNVGQYVWIRGATGVVYNNSMEHLSTSCWGLKHEIRVAIRGAEDAIPVPWPNGPCVNAVYPIPHQCGQNYNGTAAFTDPIWFWGNTGTVINVESQWNWGNPCAFNWNTFWQWGRDGQNTALTLPIVLPSIGGSVSGLGGTAKPGYTAFAYPHPLLSGSPTPTAAPTATATVTVTPTATPDVPATCTRIVTVDHTKVPSTQTNFTVLVSVTDNGLRTVGNGGHVQNSNGYDIGFYSDSGGTTKLKWEMESYDGATGAVRAWVKIASLSSTVDTVFYLIYGDASITTDQSDPPNTWDSDFGGVWHMADNAASTTILATKGSNGTNVANTSGKHNASGQVNGALNYNGTTDGSSAAIDLSGSPIITLSFWINWTTNGNDDDLAFEYTNNYNNKHGFIVDWNASGGAFDFGTSEGAGFWTDTITRPTAGAWHLIHLVMNKTTPVNKAYVDGSSQSLTSSQHSSLTGNFENSTLYFMSRGTSSLNGAGVLDEVKVSTTERSANWITAEYNNQSSPGSFITMSAETCGSPSPSPTATVTVTPTPTPAATPAPPSGLHVASVSGAVTLQWTVNSSPDSVTSYNVYRTANGVPELVGNATDPSFDVSSFLTGSRTRFYITAVNAIGESSPSHKVTVQQH